MKNIFRLRLGKISAFITIVVFIILCYTEFKVIRSMMENGYSTTDVIIVVLILIGILVPLLQVRYIKVGDRGIHIKRFIGGKIIDFNDIISIEKYSKKLNLRFFGSGGYGGFLGVFYNNKIGRFISYVGNVDEAFLIRVKTDKCEVKYVISCKDRDELIDIVQSKINKN